MPRLEREYQPGLIKRIERLLPGAYVRKADIQQGWPDLLILAPNFWALLEVKKKRPTRKEDFEPNQEWWIEEFDEMHLVEFLDPPFLVGLEVFLTSRPLLLHLEQSPEVGREDQRAIPAGCQPYGRRPWKEPLDPLDQTGLVLSF